MPKILKALLDWVNATTGEHRFTTSDTGAVLEGGVAKLAYLYDPHAAVKLTGAADVVDPE